MPSQRDQTRSALGRAASGERPVVAFRQQATTGKGRITIDLGEDLARRFKGMCGMEGRKMNDVLRELVGEWLRQRGD